MRLIRTALTLTIITMLLLALSGCDSESRKLYKQGRDAEDDNDTDAALELYNKSIEVDPGYMPSYIKIANIYLDRLEYAEAERYLKKAIEIDPEYYEAYRRLSKVYRSQQRYADALKMCTTALESSGIKRDAKIKAKIEKELDRVHAAIKEQQKQ